MKCKHYVDKYQLPVYGTTRDEIGSNLNTIGIATETTSE